MVCAVSALVPMNKHKDMVRTVTIVEKIQDEMVTEKAFTKKAYFFWFQVEDIKISDAFYKIHKFLRTSWAPIITNNGINFLMARPFRIHHFPLPSLFLNLQGKAISAKLLK